MMNDETNDFNENPTTDENTNSEFEIFDEVDTTEYNYCDESLPKKSFFWQEIEKSLMDSQKQGLYCDVALLSATREFKVHAVMLAAASEMMATILDQKPDSECKSLHTLTFPQISDDIMECFVKYIYTGSLELPASCKLKSNLDLTMQALQQLGVNFQIISDFKILDRQKKGRSKSAYINKSSNRGEDNLEKKKRNTPDFNNCDSTDSYTMNSESVEEENDMINNTSEEANQCSECGRMFKLKCNLTRHERSQHTHLSDDKWPHLCEKCGYGFGQKSDLIRHINDMHLAGHSDIKIGGKRPKLDGRHNQFTSINNFECPLCKIKFGEKGFLYHIDTHSEIPPELCHLISKYTCEFCKKGFATRHFYQKHLIEYHKDSITLYTCHYCTHSFFSIDKLTRHMEIRHELVESSNPITEYTCDRCHKKFVSLSKLQQHVVLHKDARPFMCPQCGKSFASRNYYEQIHKNSHAAKKGHVCEICNKSFLQGQHLKRHMLHHTGEKPFGCRDCNASYKSKTDLKSHYIRIHGCDMPADIKPKILENNMDST